jgi:hypothetical protein
MGIAFWLAVMVVHFTVLIACRRQPSATPWVPELEHPDRLRLRRLGLTLLPIALAVRCQPAGRRSVRGLSVGLRTRTAQRASR